MPVGQPNLALIAGPPSPEKPYSPVPATVTIAPEGDTLRIRLFALSATNRLPAVSKASPPGLVAPTRSKDSVALLAGPPSPENPVRELPATLVTVPFPFSLNTELNLALLK